MKTLRKYYWIAALAVLGLGGWAGTHVVAGWQHNNLFKKFTAKPGGGLREPMQAAEAGPATNHLEGPAIHVVHWPNQDQKLFDRYSQLFANIESIAGSAEGYYVFYRITPVQYEYKFFELTCYSIQASLANIEVSSYLSHDYVLADATRADYTGDDKRHVLLKRRVDRQPLPETGRKTLGSIMLDSTASETTLAAALASDGKYKILAMGEGVREWEGFYEFYIVETDRPETLEFKAVYIEVDDDYPDRTVSEIQDKIHQLEVTQGWRFVKADRYDGWNDWATLIFARPIR